MNSDFWCSSLQTLYYIECLFRLPILKTHKIFMLDNNKDFTHVVAIMSIMTVSKKNRTCFQQKISHRISSQVTNLITCIFVRPLEINNNMISISMLYFPAQ